MKILMHIIDRITVTIVTIKSDNYIIQNWPFLKAKAMLLKLKPNFEYTLKTGAVLRVLNLSRCN